MAATPCIFCKKEHPFDCEGAIQVLRKTPDTLRELLDGVDLKTISKKPSESDWSPREILIHLIDTEFAWGFRYRVIMGENEPDLTPYDQNLWAKRFTYGDQDATQLIRAFTPLRRVNMELLQTVDPSLYEKKGKHPQYGFITVAQMIVHLAAHDLNHLQQIRDRVPAV
ncbi:MAG TPA: DinB family protein [Acidobacteriota bacterium]|nr:DinB family protein [Acidobacteriota bacterium]